MRRLHSLNESPNATDIGSDVCADRGARYLRQRQLLLQCMTWPFVIAVIALAPSIANADHPQSPRVQNLLREGMEYLQKDSTEEATFGGKALIAYTLIKVEHSLDPPISDPAPATKVRIDDAVSAIRDAMKMDKSNLDNRAPWRALYSAAISVMFLCELDHEKYDSEIRSLLDYLQTRQRSDGGFGYVQGSPAWKLGDTSQSQYLVLAFWYAKKYDFEIPNKTIQGLMNWFISTQHPNGGFSYHATSAHREGPPTPTMTVGGTGSLYIIGNFMGILAQKKKKKTSQFDNGLPSTVSVYIEKKDREKIDTHIFQASGLQPALDRGNGWLQKNQGYDSKGWYLYYMYGYERYRAFFDLANGADDEEPDWYNAGVDHLVKLQNSDKSWGEATNYNPAVNSCFVMLFLMRNTKASVNQFEYGDMQAVGPLGEGELFIDGDGISVGQANKDVNALFAITDKKEPQDWGAFRTTLNEIELSDKPDERTQQLKKMRSLVSHRDFEARIIAVEQLGRRRDFESVPEMIFALGDPDKRVSIAAHKGLRVLSRKFDMADMKDDGQATYSDRERESFSRLKREWKKWYRQRKPDAVFID